MRTIPTGSDNDEIEGKKNVTPAASIAAIAIPVTETDTALPTAEPPAQLTPATSAQTFGFSSDAQTITYDDELILEIKVPGVPGTDTIIAYGTADGIFLPVGAVARYLDLPIVVSDDGNYASGWFLSEDRTLTIDLREGRIVVEGVERKLSPADAAAFDGELLLRADKFSDILPLELTPDLRSQSVLVKTTETFPFEGRMEREGRRAKLEARADSNSAKRWPRQETPWLAASIPIVDVELRAVSDEVRGTRGEGDLRLAGDFAFMTAEAFLSGNTQDGLIGAFIELGRQDADADLLGPLKATEYSLGDIATTTMPLGLRGTSGRGATITNAPIQSISVFEEIDLRGPLPDGYEVELYRNGILIESTRTPMDGQYEFEQVPVDYGLNVFRLLFFGPQGQRYEEVRRISVGDGRLAQGKFVYDVGIAQKEVNLLDVRPADFRPARDFGSWRANTQFAYGISQDITAVGAAALFETDSGNRWLASAGVRSGIGSLAVKADLAVSDRAGRAAEVAVGGRLWGGSFTASHTEYGGNFIDETKSLDPGSLTRASEMDINFNIDLPLGDAGTLIPVAGRLRHLEFQDDRTITGAALRGSARFGGGIVSNTFDLSRVTAANGFSQTRLLGNFDLATLSRSSTQLRASLGYEILPQLDLSTAALEVDQRIGDDMRLNASVTYGFQSRDTRIGASAVRRFDRFTLALDGQYGFADNSYSAALRLGFSFGRDPSRNRFFVAPPGRSGSGAMAVRAFQDKDGDRVYGPQDILLPDVEFIAPSQTATTDDQGLARLDNLGRGNRVSIQVDPASLPDITLIPASRGIEIVPRPGRIHQADFAILSTAELEGTVLFDDGGQQRGVSGVRLQLLDPAGEVVQYRRTELDGFYFFEQVPPGDYRVVVDPAQAERLSLCATGSGNVAVAPDEELVSHDLVIERCPAAAGAQEVSR